MFRSRLCASFMTFLASTGVALTLHSANAEDKEVVSWLKDNAAVMKTVEAGNGFDDLKAFGEMIGDAHMVGLGEATHGTREFFQFKHRLFEYLVEEKGFTIFGFEANLPETYAIDHYVRTGEGDPEALIHGMNFWTWDTEEVLELVQWMRAYNEKNGPKLRFLGYDNQNPRMGMQMGIDYLRQAGRADLADKYYAQLKEYLDASMDIDSNNRYLYKTHPQTRPALRQTAEDLLRDIESRRFEFSQKTGYESYRMALRAVLTGAQAMRMLTPPAGDPVFAGIANSFNIRDLYMADNIKWLRNFDGPDTKVVLWAHNGHVGKSKFIGQFVTMGVHLDEIYGDDYVIAGFSFYQGELQARPNPDDFNNVDTMRPLQVFRATPAWPGSIGATFEATGISDYYVDMRKADPNSPAGKWFRENQLFRQGGGTYGEPENVDELLAKGGEGLPKLIPLDTFDIMIFNRDTTRARPLERTIQRFNMERNW